MLNQAEQRIGFIYSFLEYPNALCEEDWKIWRTLIANSCAQVPNEEFRKKGIEVIRFFNFHFSEKKRQQL
jgi:hypothetical protein